jgi:hypothetical protein
MDEENKQKTNETRAKLAALVVPTVLGALLGGGLQYFLQRARPSITLLDVTIPGIGKTKTPEKKITIPDKLRSMSQKSSYLRDLDREEPLSNLAKYLETVDDERLQSKETLAWIEQTLPRLNGSLSVDDERRILFEMAGRPLFDGNFTGGLARSEDPYRAPSESELSAKPVIFPYQISDPGFKFYLQAGSYIFHYKDSSYSHFLKGAADALARFDESYLRKVFAAVRADIHDEDQSGAEIEQEINALLMSNEGLYVRALVINRGGSPVSLTPWGTLRLFASGAKSDFVATLHSSDGSYVSIKPGESQQILFESDQTVEQINQKYPGIEGVLKSETVTCKVALKRADQEGTGGWFDSATKVLTANEDIRPEAIQVGQKLNK